MSGISRWSTDTFGFNTDDGGQLRVLGAQFLSSTSLDPAGYVNPANPAHSGDTLSYPGNRPPGSTLGVTRLKPGAYEVEFINWELGGGSSSEVFGARKAMTGLPGPLGLFNTGVDDAGNPLGGGAIDPHYRLITNPDGGAPNARLHDPAAPGWIPNEGGSRWLGPRASTAAAPNGIYTYRTTVNLTGRDLASVRLAGRWAGDDFAQISVNGVVTPLLNTNLWFGWTPFAITAANAALVAGTNNLDFVVQNTGTWTGLRVEFLEVRADSAFSLLTPSSLLARPVLTITPVSATQVRVSWTNPAACQRLQAAPNVIGPWADVPGAVSGQVFPTSPAYRFFRLVQ